VEQEHNLSPRSSDDPNDQESDFTDRVLESDYDEKTKKEKKSQKSYKRKNDHKKKENVPPKKVVEPELLDFASQYEVKKEEPGKQLSPWVATMVNAMFTSPNTQNVETITKGIEMPANLYLDVPKVNSEICEKVIVKKKMSDLQDQKQAKKQVQIAVLLTQLVDDIFTEYEQMSADKVDEKASLRAKAVRICDVISVLGQHSKDITLSRRSNLQFAISDYHL